MPGKEFPPRRRRGDRIIRVKISMSNLSALRARLKQKARASTPPAARRAVPPPPWNGRVQSGERGQYFLMDQSFPRVYRHGGRPLDDLLARELAPKWAPELPIPVDL